MVHHYNRINGAVLFNSGVDEMKRWMTDQWWCRNVPVPARLSA